MARCAPVCRAPAGRWQVGWLDVEFSSSKTLGRRPRSPDTRLAVVIFAPAPFFSTYLDRYDNEPPLTDLPVLGTTQFYMSERNACSRSSEMALLRHTVFLPPRPKELPSFAAPPRLLLAWHVNSYGAYGKVHYLILAAAQQLQHSHPI